MADEYPWSQNCSRRLNHAAHQWSAYGVMQFCEGKQPVSEALPLAPLRMAMWDLLQRYGIPTDRRENVIEHMADTGIFREA